MQTWGSMIDGNPVMHLPEFIRGMNEMFDDTQIVKKIALIRWHFRSEAFRICTCAVTQLAFLLHSPISRTLFQWFNCRQIGNRSFVRVDFKVECYSSRHRTYMLLVVPLVLLFCLGLPLIVAVFLFMNRKHLHSPNVKSRMGWLYNRYTVGSEWWDIHELVRKLILCCALLFFDEALLRFAVAVVVSILSLVSLNRWHPHKNVHIFAVAELAFLGTALRYVATLAMLVEQNDRSYIGWFIISVDVAVFGCALVAVSVITANLVRKARSGWAQEEAHMQEKIATRSKSLWQSSQVADAFSKEDDIALRKRIKKIGLHTLAKL